MTLVTCGECGSEVSTQADSCPSCGAPPPRSETKRLKRLEAVGVFLLIGGFLLPAIAGAQGSEVLEGSLGPALYGIGITGGVALWGYARFQQWMG